MKNYFLIIITLISFLCVRCKDEDGGGEDVRIPAEVNTLKIEGINDKSWIYISFENGKVVGSSELGNKEEDAEWAIRKDWDIALCGEMLRTNSGTSGKGEGGIIRVSEKSFNAIDVAPADGYTTDVDNIVVKRELK